MLQYPLKSSLSHISYNSFMLQQIFIDAEKAKAFIIQAIKKIQNHQLKLESFLYKKQNILKIYPKSQPQCQILHQNQIPETQKQLSEHQYQQIQFQSQSLQSSQNTNHTPKKASDQPPAQSIQKKKPKKNLSKKNTYQLNSSSGKPILKNTLKNICNSFQKFLYYLSESNLSDIIDHNVIPETIDLQKVHDWRDLKGKKHMYDMIRKTNKIFSKKANYNVALIFRICRQKHIKPLFLFWLKHLADFWLYKYSNIDNQHLQQYRQSVPELIVAVEYNCSIKFKKVKDNYLTLPTIPSKPEWLIEPKRDEDISKRRLRNISLIPQSESSSESDYQRGFLQQEQFLCTSADIMNFNFNCYQFEDDQILLDQAEHN